MLEFDKTEQAILTELSDRDDLQIIIDADNKVVVFSSDKKRSPIRILGGSGVDITLEKLFNYMGIKVKRDKNLRVLRRRN